VSIHCLIQQNACRTLIGVHGQTVLPGDEEPCGGRRASNTAGMVLRWSQSALTVTAVSSESVYSWFDPVTTIRILIGIHIEAGFPSLEELLAASVAIV